MAGEAAAKHRRRLRKEGRAKRNAIAGPERNIAVAALIGHVVGLACLRPGVTVSAFLADDGEPDLAAAFPQLEALGVQLVLPGLVDDGTGRFDMDFRPWDVGDPTEVGPYGIVQPSTNARLAPAELDVVLTPLVAFDREGTRMGRGGGHYDRAFGPTRDVPDGPRLVATAFESQMVSGIPSEPHDVPLAAAITQLGVRWF